MLKQGPEFHFDITVIRDKRGRDKEGRLTFILDAFFTMPPICSSFSLHQLVEKKIDFFQVLDQNGL